MKVIYACQMCKHESEFEIAEREVINHTCKKCGNVLKFRYTGTAYKKNVEKPSVLKTISPKENG